MMMVVVPVMEVQQAHLYFRVAFELSEVNSLPQSQTCSLTRLARSRTLPQ
jgi:TPP-dependent indolepyruvate ferredoxin oxidoreductase alpha subunit